MTTPLSETERQHALDLYHVVDSFPEAAFDDISHLAMALCGVPIALVSLIDRDRQWFKSRQGLAFGESRRDEAFCDHAIRQPDQLFEVANALNDSRFAENPMVTGDLGIRFYAGMPLVTPSGAPIGTVCVIDREPRQLNTFQKQGLAALARLTINLMESRHRQRELERAVLFAAQAAMGAGAEASIAVDHSQCTIAIFEIQGLTKAIEERGERTMRKLLAKLESTLHAALRPGHQDSVCHSTDSADLVAVLHGADTEASLNALSAIVREFEQEQHLPVLIASAHSETVNEPVHEVFLRAELRLSALKDAAMSAT